MAGRTPRGRHGGRHPFDGGGRDRGGPFPRDFFEMLGHRPQRAERGGVRYLVLDAIADTPRHGYEIMSVISDKTRGAYKPSPGVIYPTLQLLEELGHVKVTEKDDKKVYAITAAGTRDLDEHKDEVAGFYEQSDDDVWEDQIDNLRFFMERMRSLGRAFRRSARRGRLSPETMAKVKQILDDATTKLEAVLDKD
ncbi:MAG TPA: PadR family transcriptional regulator [Kofleriaceae bacterium]|jgi:DNA-binding PadR family transcriptional regulator